MIVLFERIDDISIGEIDFYTARIDNNDLTEFELFVEKEFPSHKKELEILYSVIDEMKIRGAKSYYFKPEREANALPKVTQEIITANKKDFGIRLYCIRLTEKVVVLLNGDIKTEKNPVNCPNVQQHFKNAVKIARELDRLLKEGEVNYQNSDCLLNIESEI